MTDPLTTFRTSLEELRKLAEKASPAPRKHGAGKAEQQAAAPVDRTLVRDLLLSLGEILENTPEETEASLEAELAPARTWIEGLGERWNSSFETEMQLACGEHIQGIDPRYLSHPRYDFEYALGARQRLEQRFQALEALGLPVDEALLDRVAQADELLAAALEQRASGPGRG